MNYQIGEDSSNKNKGKVNCNKEVLLSIISLAAKEISGVQGLCSNFYSGIKRIFSSNVSDGVKVCYENGGITVDIYLNIYYGYSVTDVAHRVQENVKNGISSMIDIKVNSVNVHVMGVEFGVEANE